MLPYKTVGSTHHLHGNYDISRFHFRALANSNSTIIRAYFLPEKVVWRTINPPAISPTQRWCHSYQLEVSESVLELWSQPDYSHTNFLHSSCHSSSKLNLSLAGSLWWPLKDVLQKRRLLFPFVLTWCVNRLHNYGVNPVILEPICIFLSVSPLVNLILD